MFRGIPLSSEQIRGSGRAAKRPHRGTNLLGVGRFSPPMLEGAVHRPQSSEFYELSPWGLSAGKKTASPRVVEKMRTSGAN